MATSIARSAGWLTLTLVVCQAWAQTDPDAAKRQAERAAQLVEKIAAEPAIYMQNCSGLRPHSETTDITVSFDGRSSYSEYRISAAQFEQLRSVRDDAIAVLSLQLQRAIEPTASAAAARAALNPNKLQMLVDLNACSCLPALKELALAWSKSTESGDEEARGLAREQTGDALSAIVTILRQERFAPLLASALETEAEAAIAHAKEQAYYVELARRIEANGGKVADKDRASVVSDPILGTPVPVWAFQLQKVSPAAIAEILGWVDAYGKLPADARKDAAGMTSWPVNR